MGPRNSGDLLCSQEGVYPVPRRGRRGGGGGYGRCPVQVGGGDPQDPLWVPVGGDEEEEQGGARALLPEDLLLWRALLALERGGDRCGLAQPRGACIAGGRAGPQAGSLGNALHTTAYGGVGLVTSYTGLVGRGRVGALSAPSTKAETSPTSRSSSGGCRRWSAVPARTLLLGMWPALGSGTGPCPQGQRVLRACSRAGALLWRDMKDPAPVSRRVSPMDRGRPDRFDVSQSIQFP